jgi:glycosyltransferase involved in cell wall biosynthesis
MEDSPLISVIVPVYKVEPYLRKCVDSILSQTYQNLEVILVDDGSPDGCPAICDEYAKKDARVRVIHKENGGLVSARMVGLKVAQGIYIQFVDSDDWIEANMIELLQKKAAQTNADIVICGFYFGSSLASPYEAIQMDSVDSLVAMRGAVNGDFLYGFLWNKLIRRQLLIKAVPPPSDFMEDRVFSLQIAFGAEKISVISNRLYHYRYNENSLSIQQSAKERRLLGVFDNYCWMVDFLKLHCDMQMFEPQLSAKVNLLKLRFAIHSNLRNQRDWRHLYSDSKYFLLGFQTWKLLFQTFFFKLKIRENKRGV